MKEESAQMHLKLQEELKNKEDELRKKIEAEFNQKIRDNLRKQQEDLERRKLELESDIKSKVANLLG